MASAGFNEAERPRLSTQDVSSKRFPTFLDHHRRHASMIRCRDIFFAVANDAQHASGKCFSGGFSLEKPGNSRMFTPTSHHFLRSRPMKPGRSIGARKHAQN
jgi:hypothetical protein